MEIDNPDNQKEILLVSLIEKICKLGTDPDQLFKLICDFLYDKKILSNKTIYSEKTKSIRDYYSYYLMKLIQYHNESPSEDKFLSLSTKEINDEQATIKRSRYETDFDEIQKIGKGGFGNVYKARNKIDGNLYAIKKIYIDHLNMIKITREVKYLAKLNHHNIVRYYTSWIEFTDKDIEELNTDSDESSEKALISTIKVNGLFYIQMELCGLTLKEWMNNRLSININDCNNLFKQLLTGVKYIHEHNIIHRDLKPTNIFLDNGTLKIGDFGLATHNDDLTLNVTSHSPDCGTQLYASPEQLKLTHYDKRTDIYSLGIIYLELLHLFKTEMERIITLTNARNNQYTDELLNNFNNSYQIIKLMINNDIDQRPSIDLIIESLNFS